MIEEKKEIQAYPVIDYWEDNGEFRTYVCSNCGADLWVDDVPEDVCWDCGAILTDCQEEK